MSGHIEQDVDTNSAEFKHGVEAGLKDKEQSSTPLFMSHGPEGNKGIFEKRQARHFRYARCFGVR